MSAVAYELRCVSLADEATPCSGQHATSGAPGRFGHDGGAIHRQSGKEGLS